MLSITYQHIVFSSDFNFGAEYIIIKFMQNAFRTFQLANKRNYFIMSKDSRLFHYTFLQSSSLQQDIIAKKYTSINQNIRSLINSDFTEKDLLNNNFLKEVIDHYKDVKLNLNNQLTKNIGTNIGQYQNNVNKLILHNILDTQIWRDVFHEVLWLNYSKWETSEQFSKILIHLGKYLHKFPSLIPTYKFNIDKHEFNTILPFKDALITLFEKKSKMINTEVQIILFKLIRVVASKIDLNMNIIKQYYTRNIPQLQLLLKGKDLFTVLNIIKIYRNFNINSQALDSFWDAILEPLVENKNKFSYEELKGFTQLNLSKQFLKNKIPILIKTAKQNKIQTMLLSGLLASGIHEKQHIEHILDKISTEKLNQIQKNSLHLSLHNLGIIGYNLDHHKILVNSAAQVCSSTHPDIAKILDDTVLVKSPCLVHGQKRKTRRPYSKNNIQQWISKMIIEKLGDKYKILVGQNFCGYQLDVVLISKDSKMYVVQIKGAHYTQDDGQLKSKKQMKYTLLKYYGFRVIFLCTTEKQVFNFFKNKRGDKLIEFIQKQIQSCESK